MAQDEGQAKFQATSEEVEKIRDQFRQADTSGTGSLSKSELKQVLMSLGFSPDEDEDLERLFDNIDVDNDGEIQFDEFLFFLFTDNVEDNVLQIAQELKSQWAPDETQLEEPKEGVEANKKDMDKSQQMEQTPLYAFLCKKIEDAKGSSLPKSSREDVAHLICSLQATALADTADMDKYTNALSVLAATEGGDVVLLRGSWVKSTDCVRILKRGDPAYPENAYIGMEELCKIYQSGRTPQLPIIAISHFWRTQEDPDPKGVSLKTIKDTLQEQWPTFVRKGVSDVGIFFDFASLWQPPRDEVQTASFRRSLASINLWYAHALTTVWFVTKGKDLNKGLTYHEKGWTSFEYTLSMMIKTSQSSAASAWPQLLDTAGSSTTFSRKVPCEPLAFCSGHEFGDKIYTNGADRDAIVAPKFKQATLAILGGARILNFNKLGWGDKEIIELVIVLPLCSNLHLFQAAHGNIGNEGARALADLGITGMLAKLACLELNNNKIGHAGLTALAAAFEKGAFPLLNQAWLHKQDVVEGRPEKIKAKRYMKTVCGARGISLPCF